MNSAMRPNPMVDDPYAAPVARVEDTPIGELVLASRGTRFIAALVDTIIVMVPVMLVGAMAPMLAARSYDPRGGALPFDPTWFIGLGIIAVLLLGAICIINLRLLARNGQTMAKRMFGIKVVLSDGSPCSVGRVVLRRWLPMVVLGMIPVVGYVVSIIDSLFIFREDHRCLHDHIADTIVVNA